MKNPSKHHLPSDPCRPSEAVTLADNLVPLPDVGFFCVRSFPTLYGSAMQLSLLFLRSLP